MGVQAFKTKQYEHAFQLYTEAIRLCPRKPAYHCNRAAAALKLHQFAVAIEDARNVLKRDSKSIKAYTRAGLAHLGLGQPEAAAAMFKQALQLDASYSAAQRGLVTALRAEGRAVAAALQEQSTALSSDRAGLTREAVDAEQAAELLLTAEGMLSAQPKSHAACCSHVEALIACRRYPDAAIAANKLHAGQDKLYLQAQVLWRQADLDAAAQLLSDARQQFPDSSKSLEAQRWVESLQQEVHQANVAFEDGLLDSAVSKYTQLLASLQPGACSGLYAWLLLKTAAAMCQKRDYNAALQSLHMALEWEPENAECLQLRAEVHRLAGNFTQSFMDYQRLSKAMTDSPEVFEQLQQAAHLCMGSQHHMRQGHTDANGTAYHSILGLSESASQADIRQAYRRLAGRWHPDKWASCNKSEQDFATTQFAQIAEAYANLTT